MIGSIVEGGTEGNYGRLTKEVHQYGIDNGIPPIAKGVVLIDFDATLIPWGPLMEMKPPTEGAIEAMLELGKRGYQIVVFTSRMSRKWVETVVGTDEDDVMQFLKEQRDFVTAFMEEHNIPFTDITAEKRPAEAYIDDKAIGFRGDWNEVLNDSLLK